MGFSSLNINSIVTFARRVLKSKESARLKDDKKDSKKLEEEAMQFDFTGLDRINVLYRVVATPNPFDKEFISSMRVKPRGHKTLGVRSTVRTPWIFEKSAFRQYKADDKKILDKCFEFDWSYILMHVQNKLIKDNDELQLVKKIIKENYKLLRDAYKMNAGQDSEGDVMKMGFLSCTRLW